MLFRVTLLTSHPYERELGPEEERKFEVSILSFKFKFHE